MATSFTWPPTLPQTVQRGFSESIGVNILRSPTDAGPAKLRVRSKRPSTLNVSFIMTTIQVGYLETFVMSTISGIGRFTFPHPRTQVSTEVRIVPTDDGQMYTSTYLAPGYWTISMQLEILP